MPRIARAITQFTKSEIDSLFKTGRRIAKLNEIILLRSPAQKEIGRVLIIVPKRVGNAPVRNKLRRQIKSLFYENKLYKKGYDWVAILKPGAKDLSFTQLQDLFLKA